MRLHSNTLTVRDIESALMECKMARTVDNFVQFETFATKGSRTRTNGFEIQLGWYGNKVAGDGRRWKNTGNRGADSEYNGGGCYAATYDEWGYFIAALYRMDSELVFGHYKTREFFNSYTKNVYV